jgi:ketosteroid isomerase-like protein
MSTPIADLIQRYLEIWNERDAAGRDAAIAAVMTEDCVYIDPNNAGVEGHAALSAVVGAARENFGTLVFSLGEIVGSHHNTALFTWRLGEPGGGDAAATGHDVVAFDGDRMSRVVGYF